MPSSGALAELPVGRRVAYWRQRRNLSQQMLADRLGKSKSWVDKVERGVRALDRYSVLHELAQVLEIDVDHLLTSAPTTTADAAKTAKTGAAGRTAEDGEANDIRAALGSYVSVTGYLDGMLCPPPLPQVSKAVTHAWLTYQHGGYDVLSRGLPRLIREAQSADAYHRREDQALTAAHLLAQVYQIASSVLRKTGEHELAWLAADRATAVSMRAEDPLLTGVAAARTGNALLALGRPRAALEIHLTVANRIAPDGGASTDADRLSVYGTLLLQAAIAAARLGDDPSVRDLLREADGAASRLGSDQNRYWTSFGPTNLRLHRVATDVELGEGRRAVDGHLLIEAQSFNALLPERRAHHLLDVARAYTQLGELSEAGRMLLASERIAPSEIRERPLAHEVVSDIVRRTRGKPPPVIADLAQRMGNHSI